MNTCAPEPTGPGPGAGPVGNLVGEVHFSGLRGRVAMLDGTDAVDGGRAALRPTASGSASVRSTPHSASRSEIHLLFGSQTQTSAP